jgi:ribosomal protein S18 acetylase RimI-like enzyme
MPLTPQYWGWLNILALWVSPDLRRRGLGSQLLTRAEAEALARGCRGVYLDTFTYQNVALYTRAATRSVCGRSAGSLCGR